MLVAGGQGVVVQQGDLAPQRRLKRAKQGGQIGQQSLEIHQKLVQRPRAQPVAIGHQLAEEHLGPKVGAADKGHHFNRAKPGKPRGKGGDHLVTVGVHRQQPVLATDHHRVTV